MHLEDHRVALRGGVDDDPGTHGEAIDATAK